MDLVRKYIDYVKRNPQAAIATEDAIRFALMFLPNRYSSAACFRTELAETGLALLEFINDRICEKPGSGSDSARALNICLELLQRVQFVTEIAWVQFRVDGRQTRWKLIAAIETIKVLIRLQMLRARRTRMLCKLPLPSRREGMNPLLGEQKGSDSGTKVNWSRYMSEVGGGRSNNRPIELLGELLHIIRPVVYVAMLNRFRHDKRSWAPWVTSLAVDLISTYIVEKMLSRNSNVNESENEKKEISRRRQLLAYYLLRNPCLHYFTRKPLERICNAFSYVPLINVLSANITDLIDICDEYFYYTSAS